MIEPPKIVRLHKGLTADSCARQGPIPNGFVEEVLPQLYNAVDESIVSRNVPLVAKSLYPITVAWLFFADILVFADILEKLPTTINDHVFNHEPFPIPFIGRCSRMHEQQI